MAEELSCAGPRVHKGVWAFRPVGGVVHEVFHLEVGPPLEQKVLVVHLPDRYVVILTPALYLIPQLCPVLRETTHSAQNMQQYAQPHVAHDTNVVVDASLVV